jgi:Ca2+-binding EF-hand superfamily protein
MGERMTEEEVREILADSDLDEGKAIKVEDFARMIMNRI